MALANIGRRRSKVDEDIIFVRPDRGNLLIEVELNYTSIASSLSYMLRPVCGLETRLRRRRCNTNFVVYNGKQKQADIVIGAAYVRRHCSAESRLRDDAP